jgi:lipopolysaccharide export system protein LptA
MTLFSSTDRRASAALGAVLLGGVLTVATVVGAAVVHAQQPSGPPNALQGFSQNRDKPIKINAASLDVRDKEKIATFAGDVHLVQGDVDMRSSTLVVFYDDQPPPAQPAPSPSKSGKAPAASAEIPPPQQQQSQQIKRVEAKGGVIVRMLQKDQTATGEQGIFDMRANTVTMQGHVVISQGPNILRGDTLTVDMNSGASTLTCDNKGGCTNGRVQGLFTPGSIKQEPPPAAPPAVARPTPRRSSQSQPCGKDGLNNGNCTANP